MKYSPISQEKPSDIESITFISLPTSLWVKTKKLIKAFILLFLFTIFSLLTFTALFNSSYTNPPPFELLNENVFITANIINEDLILGPWGDSIVELVDLLGPDKVFLSIYGGPTTALNILETKIKCNYSIVSQQENPIDFESLPHIQLNGEDKLKRTEYLAEVRNRALAPLNTLSTQFDKILFLNDVIFNPKDAARLLFSTNLVEGKTDYRAACAVDFINAFKFYDTFATRDFEGNSMGLPFFPWFANIGGAQSRRDVINGKEAVRVKSCWGGMIAFEGKWFQGNDSIHFRAEREPFWDASECCLINADLNDVSDTNGIYMNPYVRVAYDMKTYKWLSFTKRFERLYSLIHDILNRMVSLPHQNSRYQEQPGEVIIEEVYDYQTKTYNTVRRTAGIGGYCGSRMLQIMKDNPTPGERMWESIKLGK